VLDDEPCAGIQRRYSACAFIPCPDAASAGSRSDAVSAIRQHTRIVVGLPKMIVWAGMSCLLLTPALLLSNWLRIRDHEDAE